MKIKPTLNYQLLGTDIRLDCNKVYNAILATNQPNYKERGLIFVQLDNNQSMLLNKTEYERIK